MPGPGGTPEYMSDDDNTTDEPPPDFGDDTDVADIDCSSTILHDLNDYIKNADDQADVVLTYMPARLTYIQQDKMNSAAYLANAVAAKANFNAEVVTINNSYAAAIDAILVNEEGAMNDTITAAELVTSALSGISVLSTTEEELTLLLNQAKIDLATAEAHLAETLSYKNDVYAEVDDIVADATAEVPISQAICDTEKASALVSKASAEDYYDYLAARDNEIAVLYYATNGLTYYTHIDSEDCYTAPPGPFTQDLQAQRDQSHEYLVDADNYINYISGGS